LYWRNSDWKSSDVRVQEIKYPNYDVTMQLWDSCGQERFQSLGFPSFCRGSDGILYFYDITNQYSFDRVEFYARKVQEVSNVPSILIGTKLDLNQNRQVKFTQAQALSSRLGCSFAIEVSCKTCEGNITESMYKFISMISTPEDGNIVLDHVCK